jgi:geranylgeranyl pyrophosphate synthase
MKIAEARWRGWAGRCESVLGNAISERGALAPRLAEAMRYAVLGGGKRLRPLLVYATGTAFGAEESALDHPAAALELIHAYSLVHDDLPAMDDDVLRRGRPTLHVAFDEATAILAGDAALIGKTPGKDAAHDKPTYPAIIGIEASRQLLESLSSTMDATLRELHLPADGDLAELARFAVSRSH